MDKIQFEEIKIAYNKLKTYIYYDNTELFLREKLVEFETDTSKEDSTINWGVSPQYADLKDIDDIFSKKQTNIDDNINLKLEKLANQINDFSDKSEFFNLLFKKIDVKFFPKKIFRQPEEENFITNKKIQQNYAVEKITAFIDLPLEIHIISVLWINRYGIKFDKDLLHECQGNRLLLNKEKSNTINNSSLFKPYFTQYQKWRDESIIVAQNLINNGKNALFINLDIKDYFHSCRIDLNTYFPDVEDGDNINLILRKVHKEYSSQVSKNYQFLNDTSVDLKDKSIIPIGLLSSYIIANHYLNDFDKIIVNKFKPAYYGRYVDDILIVLSEPNIDQYSNGLYEKYTFDFKKYAEENKLEKELIFSKIEKYILQTLYPLLKVLPSKEGNIIKIDEYDNLICQSSKTLMYYFDASESDLVIDKLKQELDFRSSEFKDLPDDNDGLGEFDKNAFYLNYTDSEGKVRTLKDYKENRYGLTVYLTNKILGATKHKQHVSSDEIEKFLKLFKGQNVIEFYRLWEKIFTYLLVNEKPEEYANFYFNCIDEILKIELLPKNFSKTKIKHLYVRDTLLKFLDVSHELVLSLNPNFLKQNKKVLKNFEYRSNKLEADYFHFFFNQITRADSFWSMRYRKTNMLRHHYVSIPLLNFTRESYNTKINLLSLNFNVENYTIDPSLIRNSPRPIKFWECTISQLFTDLKIRAPKVKNDIINIADNFQSRHFLDKAFKRFQKANSNHQSLNTFEDTIDKYQDKFYKIAEQENQDDIILEISCNNNDKKPQPTIGVANTYVDEKNIISGLRNNPNISNDRYQKLVRFLKETRKNKADIVAFPEFFIPIEIFSSLVRYSEKNQTLLITGLEHITVNNLSFNFVATIMPIEINGYKDATIVFRLKNHYAPIEELLIKGNHYRIPKPERYRYHIFNWKNIYFSVSYCFELANIVHRSLLKSKIDLLFAIEYNQDINYFSNLVESISRDLHCYVVQVNSSHFGDTRISQPTQSYNVDIVKLKGGENNVTVLGTIDIAKLREFQRKKFSLSRTEKSFKPLPPDFDHNQVIKRIKNK
jgi:hypothetical protein